MTTPPRFPAVVRPASVTTTPLPVPPVDTDLILRMLDGSTQLARYGGGPLDLSLVEKWIAVEDIGTGQWKTRESIATLGAWTRENTPQPGERFDAFNAEGTLLFDAREGGGVAWVEPFTRSNVAIWYRLPAVPSTKDVLADIALLRRVGAGR